MRTIVIAAALVTILALGSAPGGGALAEREVAGATVVCSRDCATGRAPVFATPARSASAAQLWGAVGQIAVSSSAAEDGELERAPRSSYQGKPLRWWVRRAIVNKRTANKRGQTVRRLQQAARPNVNHAIHLAAVVYGVSEREMHSVASCESGHNPGARNGLYRGLFQEGPMFERGPFGHLNVYDPYANAFTAAHTVAREGWRQWACKP